MKHLNWKSFFKQSEENFDAAQELIHNFLEATPEQLQALQEAIQLEHAVAVEHAAQSIKNLLKPYGAQRIVAKASELEAIGGRGELLAAERHLCELRILLEELYEDMQAVLRKKPSRKGNLQALAE
jgi:HPt (histidine-containing phosphotransfer) domain-containing protein